MGLNQAYGDGFVGVANYGDRTSTFLKGDDHTDGSVRWFYSESGDLIRSEKLVAGIWIPMDVEIGVSTWLVDDDLGEFVLDELGAVVYEG